MAHYLSNKETKNKKKTFPLPNINGRVGVSFYIGTKEVFIGVVVSNVILEELIRRRLVKTPKAHTRTYGFDVFSSEELEN